MVDLLAQAAEAGFDYSGAAALITAFGSAVAAVIGALAMHRRATKAESATATVVHGVERVGNGELIEAVRASLAAHGVAVKGDAEVKGLALDIARHVKLSIRRTAIERGVEPYLNKIVRDQTDKLDLRKLQQKLAEEDHAEDKPA